MQPYASGKLVNDMANEVLEEFNSFLKDKEFDFETPIWLDNNIYNIIEKYIQENR